MISYNAKPMDLVSLSGEIHPSFIPGKLRAEAFLSRMNSNRNPANDYVSGWRLGWKPLENIETNVSMLYQFGGHHGQGNDSAKEYLIEFLGARLDSPETDRTGSATNRAVEWDLRWTYYRKFKASVYTEQHLEDCCGDIANILKHRHSYLFGFSLEGAHRNTKIQGRAEYLKTTDLFNFHTKWPSALSRFDRELGPFIGRDSQIVSMEVSWLRPQSTFSQIRLAFFFQELGRRPDVQFGDQPIPWLLMMQIIKCQRLAGELPKKSSFNGEN